MFKKFQRLEVSITDVADGAKCFGRLPDGLAVFVEGPAAVGDRAAATITKIKKNFLEARLLEVLDPSPHRVAPRCAHFGVCGGCKWQHLGYAEQLRIKRKLVADALAHIGGIAHPDVADTVPAPRPFAYRNKVEFSFGDRRYLLEDERDAPRKPVDFAAGFHAAGHFEKVLDIDRCDIATERMNRALAIARSFARERGLTGYSPKSHAGFLRNLVLRESFTTGEFMAYLITSAYDGSLMEDFRAALGDLPTTFVNGVTQRLNNVAQSDELHTLSGPGFIRERIGDLEFRVSPNSFFQTNSEQAVRLYEIARDAADLRPDQTALDLFCGTGTIALFVSRRVHRVVGIELDAGAVRDAQENARLNGISNATFEEADLRHFAGNGPAPDVVITDPPRAGMHPDTVESLRRMKPRRIVYVSCNPASLARDARLLCEGGLYAPGRFQPVDMFPQTFHVETVSRFDLQE